MNVYMDEYRNRYKNHKKENVGQMKAIICPDRGLWLLRFILKFSLKTCKQYCYLPLPFLCCFRFSRHCVDRRTPLTDNQI